MFKLLVVSSIETSSLKACISVTGKKYTKNASTGPNKFNVQYHHAPELPIEPTVLLHLAAENMVVTAGAERCTA